MWVADKRGQVEKGSAVKRIPKEDRWSEDCAGWVKYTPWNNCHGAQMPTVTFRMRRRPMRRGRSDWIFGAEEDGNNESIDSQDTGHDNWDDGLEDELWLHNGN